MVHQTKVSAQNGSPESAPSVLARGVGDFAHDVLTLAELQMQLLVADVRECRRTGLAASLILLCGLALGLACFPLALAALAFSIIQVLETTYAVGLLIAVAVGAVLSALLCAIGWFQIRKRLAVLRRSQQEFVCNVGWIKKVLKRNRVEHREHRTDTSWRSMT